MAVKTAAEIEGLGSCLVQPIARKNQGPVIQPHGYCRRDSASAQFTRPCAAIHAAAGRRRFGDTAKVRIWPRRGEPE